jgi:hypothetical protein
MIEVAKQPGRSKRNRGDAAKHPGAETELDESAFAHVTGAIVVRARDRQTSKFASLLADSSKDELHKSRFLGSTAGLLVFKGEAEPSVIDPSREAKVRAEAGAARREVEGELRSLRDELAALKATLADREGALAQAALDRQQTRQDDEAEVERREREQELAELRADADAARTNAKNQIHSLQDELATLRSALTDRESALAQAALDLEQIRQRLHDGESEAELRQQSERAVEELRAEAEAARTQADDRIRNLEGDLAALRSALADREAALAKAALDHEQARAAWQHETKAELARAEEAWKTAEAARLAEAEAKWQEASAPELAELRARAEAEQQSADSTIRDLRDRISVIQAALAEREAALGRATSDTERARQELEAALAKARSWQADEAQRLAAAEAQWKAQSAKALTEAQARYQAAEGALVQLRLEADRARSEANGGSSKLPSRSNFGTKSATREPEPAPSPPVQREARERPGKTTQAAQEPRIVLQPGGLSREPEPYVPRAPRRRAVGRDFIVVMVLAIVTIVAYPRIEPFIPEPWRSNIAAVVAKFIPPSNIMAQGSAVVVREVNLREGPSTGEDIIATLPIGLNVAVLERRNEWTLVEIAADSSTAQPRRGWVSSSFLRDGSDVEEEDDAASSDDSEQ